MLVQLLEYDPLAVRPGMPGFGAGSKRPGVMFSFLKHFWSTASGHSAAEQQQQALFRCDFSHTAPRACLADAIALVLTVVAPICSGIAVCCNCRLCGLE